MEQIISEHFLFNLSSVRADSIKNFRSFNLIFDVDPVFIKIDERLAMFDQVFFIKNEEREGTIMNEYREGFWIIWYPDSGKKSQEGNYRNGKREGLWIEWWNNGQKAEEGKYQNGKQERLWVSWWNNGQKETEGNYRVAGPEGQNGKQDGLWIFWNHYGQKISETNYHNGKEISFMNFSQ